MGWGTHLLGEGVPGWEGRARAYRPVGHRETWAGLGCEGGPGSYALGFAFNQTGPPSAPSTAGGLTAHPDSHLSLPQIGRVISAACSSAPAGDK